MKTLSIDVGIRNLACCLIEIPEDGKVPWSIGNWFVLDTFEYNSGSEDDLIAVFKGYKQWKKDALVEFVEKKEIEPAGSDTKRESYEAAIKNYLAKQKITQKYVADRMLDYITDKIRHFFDSHPDCLEVDNLLIENQPSLKNPTMKSIQMILYTFFYLRSKDRGHTMNIEFISATRKMAYCKAKGLIDKNTKVEKNYKTTKQCSIVVSKIILESRPEYEPYFGRAKKDDLADCLLQGLAYHNVRPI